MEDETLLLRQVHPSFIQGDHLSSLVFSSQTFRPTLKDKGCLSVYNGEKFSPSDSYDHFMELDDTKSAGVVGVTANECAEVELSVTEDNDPFDGHCFIDYRELSTRQVKKKASVLKRKANERGWLFLP